MPISDVDIVTVNGKQWAQPRLFGRATWAQVNAACPDQICKGILDTSSNGSFDMDGWIWATLSDVTSLLNTYGLPLTPQPSAIYEVDSAWGPAFFADGWRDTGQGGGVQIVEGLVADKECAATPFGTFPCMVSIVDRYSEYPGDVDEASVRGSLFEYFTIGAWFHRAPVEVPVPSSYSLLTIGLLGLLYPRRKKR